MQKKNKKGKKTKPSQKTGSLMRTSVKLRRRGRLGGATLRRGEGTISKNKVSGSPKLIDLHLGGAENDQEWSLGFV